MGFFSTKVEPMIEKVETAFFNDVHSVFGMAKTAALDANAEVLKLKADLQAALAKAKDLHQEAINAAQAVQAKAEQDIADMKSAISAHTADLNTHASQIIAPATIASATPPTPPAQ
jgi:hypothetical protein